MRRFFFEPAQVSGDKLTLTGQDVRHIRTVLRLRPGNEVVLFDGQGSEYRARIIDSTSRQVTLSILHKYAAISESHVEITIGQALVKARKMDRVVRQLTELGVFAFIPFVAERSVPRPGPARLADRERRWETIAREALKQCGRSRAPDIGPVTPFQDLISAQEPYDSKIIFHARGSNMTAMSSFKSLEKVRKVLALIGPEGGFTDEEVNSAVHFGFVCISLGPRVLQADTAAIAASAILQHLFGDLGGVPGVSQP